MSRQVVSRSQRRLEKKQTLVLVLLGLVIALASYGLGVMVGRSGGDTIVTEDLTAGDRIAMPAADSSPVEGGEVPVPDAGDPELTFFDTLPEGKQPPMGSGINLPAQPAEPPAATAEAPHDSAPAAPAVAVEPAPAVKPQPVAPRPEPVAAAPAKPAGVPAKVVAGGNYIIQVASVQKKSGAQDLSDRLSKSGYPAFVEETDLGAKGIWFRVYVGPFGSREAADGTASSLKAAHFASSPLVRKR